MGIIGWIVLGLLAGIIAKAIFPGAESLGVIMTTLLGIGGALLGGLVASLFGFGDPIDEFFDLSTWVAAVARRARDPLDRIGGRRTPRTPGPVGLAGGERRAGAAIALAREKPGEVLEQRPAHVGVLAGELPEVPERDHVAGEPRDRGHGRRPRVLGDQGELAEVVSGPDPRDLVTVDGDGCLALGDDEEPDPAHRPLDDDVDARAELPHLHLSGEPRQLALAEPAEEPHPSEIVGDRRHRAII